MVDVHARFFLHSSAAGDLGCLRAPSIVSDTTVPVGVQTSLGVPAVLFFIFWQTGNGHLFKIFILKALLEEGPMQSHWGVGA